MDANGMLSYEEFIKGRVLRGGLETQLDYEDYKQGFLEAMEEDT